MPRLLFVLKDTHDLDRFQQRERLRTIVAPIMSIHGFADSGFISNPKDMRSAMFFRIVDQPSYISANIRNWFANHPLVECWAYQTISETKIDHHGRKWTNVREIEI